MFGTFTSTAGAMPRSRLMPPFKTWKASSGPSSSAQCAITQNRRAPTIAPTSTQNSMVLMWSTLTPRLGPSTLQIHAPNRTPIAIPNPCGDTAKSPNRWMRSRMGQPIVPSSVVPGASLPAVPRDALGHGPAEEQAAGDVGRVVHPDHDARDPHGAGQTRQGNACRWAQAGVAPGGLDEREEHRGVAARPRRGPRRADEQAGTLSV